jgi:hypothetical protein
MSFTVRTSTHYRFCVTPEGSHLYSTECKAIYATLAFAGIDLFLSFIAAIGMTFVLQWEYFTKRSSYETEHIQGLRVEDYSAAD